jgi:hypothetical protein
MSKWNLPIEQKVVTRHGEFTISLHAMQQFYRRLVKLRTDLPPEKKDSIFWFRKKFQKYLATAKQMQRKNNVRQIISHNFQPAKYFLNPYVKWVFVVDEATNVILTCYPYDPHKELFVNLKKTK